MVQRTVRTDAGDVMKDDFNNTETTQEHMKGGGCVSCGQSTHQLELGASTVGLLDAGVGPQRAQRHHVQLELAGLHPRHADPSFPRHHQHALLLILTALPADAQLVPGVHQHAHALRNHTISTFTVPASAWRDGSACYGQRYATNTS